jgi:hypothetical protein
MSHEKRSMDCHISSTCVFVSAPKESELKLISGDSGSFNHSSSLGVVGNKQSEQKDQLGEGDMGEGGGEGHCIWCGAQTLFNDSSKV